MEIKWEKIRKNLDKNPFSGKYFLLPFPRLQSSYILYTEFMGHFKRQSNIIKVINIIAIAYASLTMNLTTLPNFGTIYENSDKYVHLNVCVSVLTNQLKSINQNFAIHNVIYFGIFGIHRSSRSNDVYINKELR